MRKKAQVLGLITKESKKFDLFIERNILDDLVKKLRVQVKIRKKKKGSSPSLERPSGDFIIYFVVKTKKSAEV